MTDYHSTSEVYEHAKERLEALFRFKFGDDIGHAFMLYGELVTKFADSSREFSRLIINRKFSTEIPVGEHVNKMLKEFDLE